MKKLFFLLLLLPLLGNAQDFEYFGVRAAFTHSNKSHNLGFIGASLNSFDEGNGYFLAIPTASTFYAGAHIGSNFDSTSNKVLIIPEIGFETSIFIFGAGISINTQAIQPRIGLSFFNIHNAHIGYSIPLRENASFEGLTFTLTLNLFNLSF